MIALADALRALPLLAELDDNQLARVAHSAADVRARANEYVLHEGEVSNFYVLMDGKFEITKRVRDFERVVAVRDALGDFAGEVSLLLGTTALANVRAVEASRFARFDAETFRWLLGASGTFAATVMASRFDRLGGLQAIAAETATAKVVVIGRPWDSACHNARDFLSRNRVAFEYYELDDPLAASVVANLDAERTTCTIVKFDDGTVLENPSLRELAEHLAISTEPQRQDYDVVIVGAGPAGLAAALYGASEGLRTLLVEREAPGGQAGTSARIENYLGFPTGLSGDDLANRAFEQAKRFGAEVVVTRAVVGLEPDDGSHGVVLDGDQRLLTKTVVLASGVAWRRLPVTNLDRLVGAGVYYGASRAEAPDTRGKDVYLVGGGNSAAQAALYFADYANAVTLIVREDALARTMSDYLVKGLASRENIAVRLESEVVAADGVRHLESIRVRNSRTGEVGAYTTNALFIFIGADPETAWLPPEILRDSRGYILTGMSMYAKSAARHLWTLERDPYFLETSVPGIFAAGDVRSASIKRCAAGVGEGSMAIALAHQYLHDVVARQGAP